MTSKSAQAGKRSGEKRAKLALLRRFRVLSAFEKLPPKYRNQPFSVHSLDALEKELRRPSPPGTQSDAELEEYEAIVPPGQPPSDKLIKLMDQAIEVLLHESFTEASLKNARRETLIKDLKALGIRTKRK